MKHIRRVMTATINYDHPQNGMNQAFRAMFPEVHDFDYVPMHVKAGRKKSDVGSAFLEKAFEFKPDWIWLQVQDTDILQPDALEAVRAVLPKTVITHWTGDCRPQVSAYLGGISKACDLTLVSSAGQIPMFEAAGARKARYCQIGVDWDEDVLGIPDWDPPFRVPDVVFCGNFYGDVFPGTKDRLAAIQALQAAGIDVGVVGSGWPAGIPVAGVCHVKQQVHVYRRAKVALSINHFNNIALYYSDRQLISLVSGTPVVSPAVPGIEMDLLNIPCYYRSMDELVDHVRRLLTNPAERAERGAAGRALVMAQHTWFARIAQLLPIIEEIAGQKR